MTPTVTDKFIADAVAFFRDLQDRICASFESFEASAKFEQTEWERGPDHRLKGGGRMRVMRAQVFEKVGVNFSQVWGHISEQGMSQVQGAKESGGKFVASGISLVSHMSNPFVPTIHMNVRFMYTDHLWLAGGADLTPTFPFEDDTSEFHAAMKAACDRYRPGAYQEYKEWCDRYFYLPHRREPRGVGGIFFDDLHTGDLEKDFAFLRDVGEMFLEVYPKIVARRKGMSFTEADKDKQLIKRGRYAEFNLVYDRGTKFGFATDANPDAYLMSLPPVVKWP